MDFPRHSDTNTICATRPSGSLTSGKVFKPAPSSWVLTSNNWRLLADPLISRCPPIRLEAPTLAHLHGFAQQEGARRELSVAAIDAIRAALDWTAMRDRLPTLRTVLRMLDRAEQMPRRPMLQ